MRFQDRQPGIFCLNEGWKFTNEPFTVFLERKKHNETYAFAKAGGAGGPAASGFDDSGWETVQLPHDWVTQKPFDENESPNHGYKERGMGWYRLRFLLDETDRDQQILLEFEGVRAEAKFT